MSAMTMLNSNDCAEMTDQSLLRKNRDLFFSLALVDATLKHRSGRKPRTALQHTAAISRSYKAAIYDQ